MSENTSASEVVSNPSTEVSQTVTTDSATTETTETSTTSETSVPSENPQVTTETNETTTETPNETHTEIPELSFEEKYGSFLDKAFEGQMTEQDYKDLKEKGIGKQEFDMIAEAHKVQTEQYIQKLYSHVGGESQYRELQDYANRTFSAEQKEAFNLAINYSQDIAKLVILGVQSEMQREHGFKPQLTINGNPQASSAVKPYASREEYYKQVNNPQYGRDPNYTRQVNERRNASGF